MDEQLVERFEEQRPRLRAVAARLLGSTDEADDALQDAWLRAGRADRSEVVNLGGWLTTIVARVCLDRLRSRRDRREQPLDDVPVPDSANREHCAAIDRLRARLLLLHTTKLEELAPTLSHPQWTRLNWCLKSISDIKFNRIRARYSCILAELTAVANAGHLDDLALD